jgi:hypothetical protein
MSGPKRNPDTGVPAATRIMLHLGRFALGAWVALCSWMLAFGSLCATRMMLHLGGGSNGQKQRQRSQSQPRNAQRQRSQLQTPDTSRCRWDWERGKPPRPTSHPAWGTCTGINTVETAPCEAAAELSYHGVPCHGKI